MAKNHFIWTNPRLSNKGKLRFLDYSILYFFIFLEVMVALLTAAIFIDSGVFESKMVVILHVVVVVLLVLYAPIHISLKRAVSIRFMILGDPVGMTRLDIEKVMGKPKEEHVQPDGNVILEWYSRANGVHQTNLLFCGDVCNSVVHSR